MTRCREGSCPSRAGDGSTLEPECGGFPAGAPGRRRVGRENYNSSCRQECAKTFMTSQPCHDPARSRRAGGMDQDVARLVRSAGAVSDRSRDVLDDPCGRRRRRAVRREGGENVPSRGSMGSRARGGRASLLGRDRYAQVSTGGTCRRRSGARSSVRLRNSGPSAGGAEALFGSRRRFVRIRMTEWDTPLP